MADTVHKPYTLSGTPSASMVEQIDYMLEELYRGFNTDPLSRADVLPVDLGDPTDVTGDLPLANLEDIPNATLVGNASGGIAAPTLVAVSTDFTLAGGTLALAGAVAGVWSRVAKLADTDRTNDTLSADPDLQFAMLASKTYIVRGKVWLTADGTPAFKFRFTGPASPTKIYADRSYLASATFDTNYTRTFNQRSGYDAADVVINGAGGSKASRSMIEFTYTVQNGANAGTFALEWAQNVTDAVSTTVNKGSWLEYRQLD